MALSNTKNTSKTNLAKSRRIGLGWMDGWISGWGELTSTYLMLARTSWNMGVGYWVHYICWIAVAFVSLLFLHCRHVILHPCAPQKRCIFIRCSIVKQGRCADIPGEARFVNHRAESIEDAFGQIM